MDKMYLKEIFKYKQKPKDFSLDPVLQMDYLFINLSK